MRSSCAPSQPSCSAGPTRPEPARPARVELYPHRALPPLVAASLLFSALLAATLQNSRLLTSRSRTGRARAPGGRDLKPGAVREGKGPDTAPLSDPVGS